MRNFYWQISLGAFLLCVVVNIAVNRASAGEGHCTHCGCDTACQKVCRLVCEQKKVEIVCWGCKCEDFCLGGHSKAGCKHSETVCESFSENCDGVQTQPKKFIWHDWIPCSAKMYTKKKLMKKVETKKIPSYKWVVEELCDHCEKNCDVADIFPGTEVPPPPVADAKLIYGRYLVSVPNVETK